MSHGFHLTNAQRAFIGRYHYHKNVMPKTWFMRSVGLAIATLVGLNELAKYSYGLPNQPADANLFRWNWNTQRLAVKHAKLQGLQVPEQYAHLAEDGAAEDEE